MPSWIEFRLACRGLLRLARLNPDFLRFFDRSAPGALRSFWVVGAYYFYFILVIWLSIDAAIASPARYLLALSVAFVLVSVAFPLILLALGRFAEREAEAVAAIAVYNWAAVLSMVVQAPIVLLLASGASDALIGTTGNITLVANLVWEWFLLRHSLRIQWWQALALTAIDALLSQVVVLPLLAQLGAAA